MLDLLEPVDRATRWLDGWRGAATRGGYINTVINLGAGLNGQTIRLRFRMGTDQPVAALGVRLDTISIVGGSCP